MIKIQKETTMPFILASCAAIVGYVAPTLGLSALGFGTAGVAAGSVAAGVQAGIGAVAAGSTFAAAQSGEFFAKLKLCLIKFEAGVIGVSTAVSAASAAAAAGLALLF